ncbi:helix-turn-helix domain-containing protein [Chryseobacterium sp. RU37D]|uniref:helix-turn-helix domain-containing protein n=1 Tax=Chryseobacterium sp. RU37D TaxID=1907397 RepID=UPI0015C3E794|nr:helix-turn-helix domain-containing protein [Chryseobacterium sp. RU37D]
MDVIDNIFKTDTIKAFTIIEAYQKSSQIPMRYWSQMTAAYYYWDHTQFAKAKKLYINILSEVVKNKFFFEEKSFTDIMTGAVGKLFYIEKALGNYNQALYYAEKYKNYLPPELYNFLYSIIRIDFGDYELGIKNLKEDIVSGYYAKHDYRPNDILSKQILASRYNVIGDSYQKWYIKSRKPGFLDSADHYYQKATVLMVSNNFMPEYTNALYVMRKAKICALKNDYKNALGYYKQRKYYPIIKEKPRTEQVFDLGTADCYLHLNEIDSSIVYAQRYLMSYDKIETSKEALLMAYHILSECYANKKKNDSAYFYAKKCTDLITDLEKNHLSAKEFIHDYDVNSIAESSGKTIKKIRNRQVFLIGLMIIVLIAFCMYLIRIKQTNKEKHKIFLSIISELKSKDKEISLVKEPELFSERSFSIDEEQMEKISSGLMKMENRLLFLKPEFKLAFVAKKLNTNTAYLSQYFNQYKEQNFSGYVQELRINYVLLRLKEDTTFRKYTLQAIAEEIGYKDATTFTRLFKKRTGITPSYYIKQLNEAV